MAPSAHDTASDSSLDRVAERALEFVSACQLPATLTDYRLCPASEESAYARCFAVFVRHLLGDPTLVAVREPLAIALRRSARERLRALFGPSDAWGLVERKHALQLLTFSLSALAALDALEQDPLLDLIEPLCAPSPEALAQRLERWRVGEGVPGTGNPAMFEAILLLHIQRFAGADVTARLQAWTGYLERQANPRGLWGSGSSPSYHEFQNGYHQYEVLQYLADSQELAGVWPKARGLEAARAVLPLLDRRGHAGVVPGGGGCHDYDAIALVTDPRLTWSGGERERATQRLLALARAIVGEQGEDGGFCESRFAGWDSLTSVRHSLGHMAWVGPGWRERVRGTLRLVTPSRRRLPTHWTRYARAYGESNLWDTWFRLLGVARVSAWADRHRLLPEALTPALQWRSIDYPGIGYWPLALRQRLRQNTR